MSAMHTPNLPIATDAPLSWLGGLTAREFLRDYWQKRPLYIPNAFPGFSDLLTREQLFAYARQEDVISRLVQRGQGDDWQLEHGPFTTKALSRLPSEGWALLVQNLNHLLPSADALLQHFSFVPYARLDDLMISYAPDGGGVGPHYDSYDVFLLQGSGSKAWQISVDGDRSLIPDIPLRILSNFQPEQQWVLQPGDMLYLPPHCAHHGIQQGAGTTYSIGFRTPSHQELASQFLMFLAEKVDVPGMYADPTLAAQSQPGQLDPLMLRQCVSLLQQVRWGEAEVADFLCSYLSAPKQHVWFDEPARPLSAATFAKRAQAQGVQLDRRSLCLYHEGAVWLNGEPAPDSIQLQPLLRLLADQRVLAGQPMPADILDWLYEGYCAGFIHLS